MRHAHTLASTLVLALLVPLLSGCLGDQPTVALLIADGSPARSAVVDVKAFEERVQSTCEKCLVKVYDAEGDAAQQKSQARQALAESTDVLVVVPIEPEEMESVTQGEVPLISLGTLVPGSDGHVGLDDDGALASDGSSDLEAARNLLLGKRSTMTYVPTVEMSEQAADVSVALLAGDPVKGGEKVEGVQSWLYPAEKVTLDTLTTVLVGQGVLTLDELCEGTTAERCEQIGLL